MENNTSPCSTSGTNTRTVNATVSASGSSGEQLSMVVSSASPSNSADALIVTIPQGHISGSKGVQSVIQQPQQSVIQSTALQALQLSKGGSVYILKPNSNSVIQSAGSNNVQALQVVHAEGIDEPVEPSRKRQILARRPSYKKILNDISGGDIVEKGDPGSSDSSQDETANSATTFTLGGQQYPASVVKVISGSALQLSSAQTGEGLQTIAMTNAASAGGAIVHYGPGNSDGQLIVPVAATELSSLKIATTAGNVTPSVVLATTTTGSPQVHNTGDNMAEEATRKREIRLMKNREAARECRAKKKEYIKCLENRVAVLENQNRTLIEELKTLKALYGLNDVKE